MIAEVQIQHESYDRLSESQYASPDTILKIQRRQLERLLLHAKQHVPFYESRLDTVISRHGEVDFGRWNEIPIVRRSDLIQSRSEMLSTELPAISGRVTDSQTTGSTGRPVTVSHTAYSVALSRAATFRGHDWHGLDRSANLLAWVDNNLGAEHGAKVSDGPVWGPPWLKSSTGRVFQINRYANAVQVLSALSDLEAGYLTCRPKIAQFLALEAMRKGIDVRLKGIIGFSTAVLQDEREDCLKAFGASFISFYSSKESQLIGFQCPAGRHYHVNDEIIFVEIVDDQNLPCAPGEIGRVLVTPLYNFAQPLIRYEQGDLAVAGSACGCGRNLSTIERVVGQSTHLFRLPDGRRVAPMVPERLRRLLNADYWQIAQVAPLRIEVRYVMAPGTVAPEGIKDQIADLLRLSTHPDVTVELKQVDSLPTRVEGGKFLEVICELPG